MDGLGRADISSPMTHRGPLPCPSPVALSPEKALVLNQMPGGWGDCGHGQKTAASDAWAIDLPPNKESGVGGCLSVTGQGHSWTSQKLLERN